MTVIQEQCLLLYLGYAPGPIDGADGPKTQAALESFRADYGMGSEGLVAAVAGTAAPVRENVADTTPETEKNAAATGDAEQYLQADGRYHIPRGVDVQITPHFRASEIHCQGVGCCTESVISKRIMDLAEAIRVDIGEPLDIGGAGGSGYRCKRHNAEIGGAVNSLHMISDAIDLHYRDPDKLKAVALRHVPDGEVGRYTWGCHVGRWDRGYVSQFVGNT